MEITQNIAFISYFWLCNLISKNAFVGRKLNLDVFVIVHDAMQI